MRCATHQQTIDAVKHAGRMRERVACNNVYRWAGKILSHLMNLNIPDLGVSDPEDMARLLTWMTAVRLSAF